MFGYVGPEAEVEERRLHRLLQHLQRPLPDQDQVDGGHPAHPKP